MCDCDALLTRRFKIVAQFKLTFCSASFCFFSISFTDRDNIIFLVFLFV